MRRPAPNDRRAQRLFLTQKVAPPLERLRALADETREEATAGLPQGARRQLFETLQAMRRNLARLERFRG